MLVIKNIIEIVIESDAIFALVYDKSMDITEAVQIFIRDVNGDLLWSHWYVDGDRLIFDGLIKS